MLACLLVFADSTIEPFKARQILACSLEDLSVEQCAKWDIVVSSAKYEITLMEDRTARGTWFTFPLITELNDFSFIPRERILCDDPEAIGVAKYSPETNSWHLLETSQIVEEQKPQIQLKAKIEEPGIYAVVRKDPVRLRGQLVEGEGICVREPCSSYQAFESRPLDSYVTLGEDITLRFCKILTECDATADGICDSHCGAHTDPDCVSATCKSEEDNCCLPLRDNVCDPDCWKKITEDTETLNEIIKYSTDFDCMQEGAEKYVPYGENNEPDPIDIERTIRSSVWKDVEPAYFNDVPRLLEGPISLIIEEGDGVWIRDFTYTDLQDNEVMLMPLRPSKNSISNDDAPEQTGHLAARYNLFANPHMLYQHKTDKDGNAIQFYLPPTAVKKISFQAKTRKDDSIAKIKFVLTAHEGNADSDNDGWSNYDDCHDNNPFINPGADEICDGIDNNCNAFKRYNLNEEAEIEDRLYWSYWDRSTCDGSERCTYLMPCEGYLQFKAIDDSSYMEVWRQDRRLCEGSTYLAGDSYSVSCDAPEYSNGIWNSYQAVFAYGNDGMYNYAFYADGDDNPGCALGAHASCMDGAFPPNDHVLSIANFIGGDERLYSFDNNAQSLHTGKKFCFTGNAEPCEYPVDSDALNLLNNEINRIELKKNDMIWGTTFGCDAGSDSDLGYICDGDGITTTGDFGTIDFEVYCYPQEPVDMATSEYVDEGLEFCERQSDMDITVHFCPQPEYETYEIFDFDERECADTNVLCSSITTNDNHVECNYVTNPETDNYGYKKFHVFVCPEGLDCYKFYSGDFRICAEEEVCSQLEQGTSEFRNDDLDCDGLPPFDVFPEGHSNAGKIDKTKPLDPDCFDVDLTGECKPEDRTWYMNDEVKWTEDGYCLQCGATDSSCAISCEPGQLSCEGGCLEGACDLAADKICKGGSWTKTGYSSACGMNDSWIGEAESTAQCTPSACDTEKDKVCHTERWRSTGGAGTAYCDLPACKVRDASCAKPCTPGACDVYDNAYCKTDGTWSTNGAADYCSKCGAIDSGCGSIPCQDDYCDVTNKKVCKNEVWVSEPTEYCGVCSEMDPVSCQAACPANPDDWTTTETDCTDGIDNDCLNGADCVDPACRALCTDICVPLRTDSSCGLSEGICYPPGTRTCGMDGRWGECIGGTAPMTEVCNSVDDDCDGAVDEGCDCTIGQSRSCGFDSGSCRAGVQRCEDGKWGYCYRTSRASPTTEQCGDGIDNDCDGETDEACPCVEGSNQTCGQTIGVCKSGLQVCTDGTWGACVGEITPMKEDRNTGSTCSDGIDNDCDGNVDSADDGCGITPTDQLTPTCFDGRKNQDETDIDCGGVCETCVTPANCNNRKTDPGEEGVDCGGECSVPCNDRTRMRSSEELETEEETYAEAECGDAYCDEGEEETCPEDCEEPSEFSFTSILIPLIIIIGLALGGFVAYKKGLIKLKGKEAPKKSFPAPKGASGAAQSSQAFRQMPASQIKAAAQKLPPRKEIKTREELELEKSFKEQSELLKK